MLREGEFQLLSSSTAAPIMKEVLKVSQSSNSWRWGETISGKRGDGKRTWHVQPVRFGRSGHTTSSTLFSEVGGGDHLAPEW
jgi:hypothetical protein